MKMTRDQQLLRHFAQNDDESALAELIARYSATIFASALRRCSDRQLAEEVCQDVLAIMARRAMKLSRHPYLLGWLLKTVKLRTLHARRSASNRAKRHQDYFEMNHDSLYQTSNQAQWDQALPFLDDAIDSLPAKDRKIVQLRFFQNASFNAISQETGLQPGACQMRATRALDKLRQLLARRGASLSIAAIASGLASQSHQAAAAVNSQQLCQSVLSSAAQFSQTNLVIHSFQIMTYGKQSLLIGFTLFAGLCLPWAWHWQSKRELLAKVASLESELHVTTNDITKSPDRFSRGSSNGSLRLPRTPEEMRAFVRTIDRAYRTEDMAISKALSDAQFFDLDSTALKALLAITTETPALDGARLLRGYVLSRLSESDPLYAIDVAGDDTDAIGNVLKKWAVKDPDAAMKWFEQRIAKGQDGKGDVELEGRHDLIRGLANGMAARDLSKAQSFIKSFESHDPKAVTHAVDGVVRALHTHEAVQALADKVAQWPDGLPREKALKRLAYQVGQLGSLQEATKFLERLDLPDIETPPLISAITAYRAFIDEEVAAEAAQWILDQAPQGEASRLITGFIDDWSQHHTNAAANWAATLDKSPVRDTVVSRIVANAAPKDPHAAFAWARTIDDSTIRNRSLSYVYRSWKRVDAATADTAFADARIDIVTLE